MVNYLIDILFLIIAVITIILFTKRGFIQALFDYGKTVMAVIASYIFGPKVGNFLYDKFIYSRIYNWISSKIDTVFNSLSEKINIDSAIDEIPFIVKQFVTPEKIKNRYGETINNVENSAHDLADFVSTSFARVISNFLSYLLVFIIALVLLYILSKLFGVLTKLPIIHGVNSFIGFLLGIVAAFVFLSILTYVLSLIIGVFGNLTLLEKLVSSSYLFGFFSEIHLFDIF